MPYPGTEARDAEHVVELCFSGENPYHCMLSVSLTLESRLKKKTPSSPK